MTSYIKEYGINNMEYEYVQNNASREVLDLLCLQEVSVRQNFEYFNELGITNDISKIIVKRPDLIFIPKTSLSSAISKINLDLFKYVVKNNIEDLIMLGV